jgi:choline kinase
VLEKLLNRKDDIVISADKQYLRYWKLRLENPLDDVESFATDMNGCISTIGQKTNSLDEIEAQYIGLMRFKGDGLIKLNSILGQLSNTSSFDTMYMTDLLTVMINKNICLKPSYHENCWLEIDTVDDLHLAEQALDINADVNLMHDVGNR